jgi:hypothetical protein
MAKIFMIVDQNTKVALEADERVGQVQAGVADQLEASVNEVKHITARLALGFADTMTSVAKEARPDEMEMTFGIKMSAESGWVIAKAGGEANFEVKLVWKSTHRA